MKLSTRAARRKELNEVQVASPCPARWEEMEGDEKVRFCQGCRQHVYNLSAMDVEEAAELVARDTDDLCIRFYRRLDGTVMTRDCPVGARKLAEAPKPGGPAFGFIPNSLAVGFVSVMALSILMPTMGGRARPAAQIASLRTDVKIGDVYHTRVWLDRGLSPDCPTTSGKTLLMYAAQWGKADVAKLLLVRGANVNARDQEGNTALQLAKAGKHHRLVAILKKAGATE